MFWGFPGGSDSKKSTCNAGDLVSIPGLGRSPGGGHGNSFQCSCLENSMDCIVHGVAKSQTRLSDLHFFSSLPSPAIDQTTVYLKQNKALFANLVKNTGSSRRTPFKYYQNKCGLYLILRFCSQPRPSKISKVIDFSSFSFLNFRLSVK